MITSVAYFGVKRTVRATMKSTTAALQRARYMFDNYFIAQLKSQSESKAVNILSQKVKEYLSAQEQKDFVEAFLKELKRLINQAKQGYRSEFVLGSFGDYNPRSYRLTCPTCTVKLEALADFDSFRKSI